MSRPTVIVGLVFVLALAGLNWAKTSIGKPLKQTLNFAGKKHTYYVFTPPGLTAPAPLLLLLHGSGNDGMSLIDPWKKLAENEGIILVAPDSINSAVWDQRIDGPDFLHAVLTEVGSHNLVDPKRLYLFGHSGGAMYALYLSLIESEYFAATAIHAGALLESNFKAIDSAKRKIPIAIWVGNADASFPLDQVKATADAFKSRGFPVDLHIMPGHDHNYYFVADEVNAAAWKFLRQNKLDQDAYFQLPGQPQIAAMPDAQNRNAPDLPLPALDPALWADAKTYLDETPQELTSDLHELHGLEPSPDQSRLATILKLTSDRSMELISKIPNVISEERVDTTVDPGGPTSRVEYGYLLLRHETGGEVALDEYRTDKKQTATRVPLSRGSVNAWVLFHPGNLEESRFRLLGRQNIDGHATLVLAFAQIPGNVKFPAYVNFLGSSVPVVFQGIAWIDESDFRIVRLRTDLLAPRPEIFLREFTSEVRFSEVRILVEDSPVSLWLPREAKVTWNFKGWTTEQLHTYSAFRTYHTKSKLVIPKDRGL